MRKKILVVTGIRSEYDVLYPVLKALNKNDAFDLKLVVSGAHLSDWHGDTLQVIEKDGFEIVDKLDSLLMTNRMTQRAKGSALLIYGLAQAVERVNPDILLFDGDREESIATCIVGTYMNKLVAHMGGGDSVFGNADDPIRMSCSELAHIHFVSTVEYAKNLERMGEERFRICICGEPALNNIVSTKQIGKKELSSFLNMNITDSDYIVVLKHPLSSEVESSYTQMSVTMKAVRDFVDEFGVKVVGIYPNTDPGSYDIINAINENLSENIKFYKTLPRDIFVNVMRNTKALVGNSSMGILEAPMYKLPVVNVGNRQLGRLNAGNVEFVPYDVNIIKSAIRKACYDNEYRDYVRNLKNPYGDGYAHTKIVDFLEKVDLSDKKWYIKRKIW